MMQPGVIFLLNLYIKENSETIKFHFHEMLGDEIIEKYMIRNNIKFKK